MNIFVGNLSFRTTEDELQRAFEAFGEVDSVKIILDRETLKSRGFAFVEMHDQEQAQAAIAGMNGKELAGQTLKVNEAKPREPRSGQNRERSGGGFSPGGRGGGWGSGSKDQGRSSAYNDVGSDIYDKKGRSGGGSGNRGRSGRGSGSGGRSGGGRRSY